jgi:membrane-associated phospholipid phosphatase
MLKDFFYRFPTNVMRCFEWFYLPWHLLAILLTYLIVTSGFDWLYFGGTRAAWVHSAALPASLVGGLLPFLLPIGLYIFGRSRKSFTLANTASALAQAAIIGSVVSSFYKALTGRLHPILFAQLFPVPVDISRIFNFGFLNGGIFWGWPSSHTTIAFAMAVTLIALYPRRKDIVIPSALYALYIGLGVSVTIHWFSDFIAGTIFGTLIGIVVAKSFKVRLSTPDPHPH